MKLINAIIATALVLFCTISFAEERPTYTIGIKESGPFAFQQNGEWKGLSVDLIDQLSERVGFNYKFEEVKTITGLLSLSENNATDMAIGAISMTDDRERVVDFSHPYFSTTTGILVKENGNTFLFVAKRVAIGIAILIATLYVIGFIVSRLDPDDEINNAHKGAWFTLVTFTTTGYGDYVPSNARAKVFAGMLMITSLFALSAFTGYISSALTVEKLTDEPTAIQDLYDTKVATVSGSTSDELLTLLGISHEVVTTPDQGVEMVAKGKIKAFVHDKALLDYMTSIGDNSLHVWPINRGQERYAIAFQSGSDLRESFNVAILDIIDSPEWKQSVAKYFGN
jgi:ABC-type amino acid transport substrate-binding protein